MPLDSTIEKSKARKIELSISSERSKIFHSVKGRSQKWVSRFGPLWTFLHMLLKLMVDSLVLKSEEPAEIER